MDFFRQNTVHVDGLGGLCNHAVFEFRKRTKPEDDDALDAQGLREEYFGTSNGNRVGGGGKDTNQNQKDQKMAQSQYYFMQRLGRYEGGRMPERYHRGYFPGANTGPQIPPNFPPLSPLREAANGKPRSGQRQRAESPQRSMLLDLQGRPMASSVAGRRKPAETPGRRGRRPNQKDEMDLPREEVDLTTSRLIEADHSLGDSWKFDQDEDEAGSAGQRERGRTGDDGRSGKGKGKAKGLSTDPEEGRANGDAGVVGLLMEYTKAHQGMKKGGRIA